MVMLQTGKVIGGKIVLDDDEPLPEGEVVTIIRRDPDEAFDLSPDQEERLLRSMAQADRGELISSAEMRTRLRRAR